MMKKNLKKLIALMLAITTVISCAAMLVGYLGSFDPELFGDHVVESSLIMKTMSSVDLFGIAEGLVK